MKKIRIITIFSLVVASAFVSCQQTAKKELKPQAGATHYCPMHPEVQGKEGDICTQCGTMKLLLLPTIEKH